MFAAFVVDAAHLSMHKQSEINQRMFALFLAQSQRDNAFHRLHGEVQK